MSKRLMKRANVLVFSGLIAFLTLITMITWERFAAARSARLWTNHTYEVLSRVRKLEIAVRDAEAGQLNYLLTAKSGFLTQYDAALGRISTLIGDLQRLTADNQAEQTRLRLLAPAWQQRAQQLAQTFQVRRDQGLDQAIQHYAADSEQKSTAVIAGLLKSMTAVEERLLAERLAATDHRGGWVRSLTVTTTLVAILALAWAAWLLNQGYLDAYGAERHQRVLAGRLQASLDSLSQGVGVFGPRQRLRHWNKCFQVLLGLPPVMVRMETPYDAFVEYLAANGERLLEQTGPGKLDEKPDNDPIVYECIRADGRLLEICRTPTSDGGFVLTISDMTQRAQAEGVLREAQKMQAIGQLTGGIAHDFNNLLTVIQGNLELAQSKLEPHSPLILNIERSLWATQRGATLTSQLLSFARKQPLAPAAIDLSAGLPDLVPLLRRTLGEHIDLRFIDTPELWPAMADPAQLESAVLNLALNARDAMPGGGRLTIEVANMTLDADYARANLEVEPGDYVMVAVSDTGIGMTPEVVARVFEPFFTTKAEGAGTGLGLAMVFGFAKQSAGHVKVYSEPGEGTSVKIYLPRAMGATMPAAQRSLAAVDLPRGSSTILVVEDEAGVREIAVAILRSLGYRVLEAADGESGLRTFGANAAEVNLLLTDVVLPGKVRGRELADRITAMRPDVKVLFMSGYTENSIVHHGRLDAGVQLLGKPFKREQLARKVAEVLGEQPDAGDLIGNVVGLRTRVRDM